MSRLSPQSLATALLMLPRLACLVAVDPVPRHLVGGERACDHLDASHNVVAIVATFDGCLTLSW
jgi:hypothetical protein